MSSSDFSDDSVADQSARGASAAVGSYWLHQQLLSAKNAELRFIEG